MIIVTKQNTGLGALVIPEMRKQGTVCPLKFKNWGHLLKLGIIQSLKINLLLSARDIHLFLNLECVGDNGDGRRPLKNSVCPAYAYSLPFYELKNV